MWGVDGADVVGGDVEERCGVEVEAVDAVDFVRLRRTPPSPGYPHAVRDRFGITWIASSDSGVVRSIRGSARRRWQLSTEENSAALPPETAR